MFSTVKGSLMNELYRALPGAEQSRIERLEFLDEIELLYDLLKHYAITWSFNDPHEVGLDNISIFD